MPDTGIYAEDAHVIGENIEKHFSLLKNINIPVGEPSGFVSMDSAESGFLYKNEATTIMLEWHDAPSGWSPVVHWWGNLHAEFKAIFQKE